MVDAFAYAHIRVGSLILLSSVSQLAAAGTAAYTESIVRATKYLLSSFSDKVTVCLGVPVLAGCVEELSLVLSLLEVATWQGSLPTKEQWPSEARKAFVLSIKSGGTGNAIQAEKTVCQLPVSLTTFEKKPSVAAHAYNYSAKFILSIKVPKNLTLRP
jgi:hypothetical protein